METLIVREYFDNIWTKLLRELVSSPSVSPRGLASFELLDVHFTLRHPRHNLLVSPSRKLAYKYAVAEWLWVWFGRSDVLSISQYNPQVHHFSDDGITFTGAYGPRVRSRWPAVIELLKRDPDTRQAVVPIYTPPFNPTKDVPCTLSLQFLLRSEKLHAIVNMRSSDVWLGLPYDVFTFTMLQNVAAAELRVELGEYRMNLGSSHLYARDLESARLVLDQDRDTATTVASPQLPGPPPTRLEYVLVRPDISQVDLEKVDLKEPWATYARALCAKTNAEAINQLSNRRIESNG